MFQNTHKDSFSIIFLLPLLQLTVVSGVNAETWTENGFIRISDKIPTRLQEQPLYFVQDKSHPEPDFRKFIPFDNKNDEAVIKDAISQSSLWFRVALINDSPDTLNIALRLYSQCKRLAVYHQDGDTWTVQHAGHAYAEKAIPGSFYESLYLILAPGNNIIYLNHETPLGRFTLFNFDFVHPEELSDDKIDMIESISSFIFVLVAFLFIIIFQLGYVAVQWYCHRRPEYLDYLSYLFLIGLYFFLRYVMIFRIDFFLYHFSDIIPVVNDVLLVLPYLYYLRFSRHFMNMKEHFPDKDRQIRMVEKWIAIAVIILAIVLWMINSGAARFVSMAVLLPLFFYSIYLVVYFYKHRDSVIRFFLVGSICAATGHFLAMMFSLFPYSHIVALIPPISITIVGLVLEMFFFNMGLGYKAKAEQNERLKLELEYYKQIEETRKVQGRLQHMRNHIASDLHDDVGSTLSSIGIYSQLASLEMEKNPAGSKDILDKISKSTQRMMEAMSDIVWAIHSRNDEGIDLFIRMRQFAVDHLELAGVDFEMEVDEKAASLTYTMEAKRNLMLLFKEIIHNASKYSQATLVKCNVFIDGEMFVMAISDNGVGFNVNADHKGHGLPGYDMRTRSLGGTFLIDSSENGTLVSIRLPPSAIMSSPVHYN